MNAKETLKKLAEALGVASEQPEEATPEAPVEKVEAAPEETTPEEAVSEPEAEAAPEAVEAEEAPIKEGETSEEAESPEAPEAKQDDAEVKALKDEIESLKKILKAAIEEESKEVEIPKQETKPLTHSPEKKLQSKASGIGNKGGSIQERVYKYINNAN